MFRYSPHPHSQLIHDDLSARLAPLDRYGLAECASVLVDGVVALANWSQGSLMRQLTRTRANPGAREARFGPRRLVDAIWWAKLREAREGWPSREGLHSRAKRADMPERRAEGLGLALLRRPWFWD